MSQTETATSDEELLAQMAQGDADALSAFYERYASRVLGLVQKMLQNRSDAEDVLQETFLQIWEDAATYDVKRGLPRVWLFMVGRSRALDRIRRRTTTVSAETRSLDVKFSFRGRFSTEKPATVTDPSAPLLAAERRVRINTALERLPPEQAQLISMAFYGGFSHSEISQKLEIPLGTVKTRIRSGILSLAEALGSAEGGVASLLG